MGRSAFQLILRSKPPCRCSSPSPSRSASKRWRPCSTRQPYAPVAGHLLPSAPPAGTWRPPSMRRASAAEGITTKLRAGWSDARWALAAARQFVRDAAEPAISRRSRSQRQAYPGEHQPIVDTALWDQVQAGLADRRGERSTRSRSAQPSLLAGLVYDAAGNRLTPSHAKKGSNRDRYYLSKSLIADAAAKADGLRLPAGELDAFVIGALLRLIRSPGALLDAASQEHVDGVEQRQLLSAAKAPGRRVGSPKRCTRAVHRPESDRPCRSASGPRRRERGGRPADRLHPVQGRASGQRRVERRYTEHVMTVPASLKRAGRRCGWSLTGIVARRSIRPWPSWRIKDCRNVDAKLQSR